MNFMIVKSLSPYNGIIGRPGLKAIQAHKSVITSSVIPSEERTRPANFKLALHPDFPDQEVAIGGTLSDKGRTELCSILKKNLDIFTWQPSDMTGVPRSVAEHRLNIREGYSPVRQKKRGQAPERAKAIQAKVQKLVEAGIMREVYYHDWLSNPALVKKHDGSGRMCVDFTDLNKACPQDCYPLPEIDWKVESLCGYPFKCFLDAYKGYHQIQLAEADEEKTAFHTRHGSYTEAEMMRDIEDIFRTLRKVNMKLNLKKCSFGLAEGVFLGDFHWTVKAKQAFQQLKQHLSELPILVAPKPQEDLIIYLSATYEAISAVLMTKRGTAQTPRTSIKGQILADFLIEMPGDVSQAVPAAKTQEELWTLFTDGSSCMDGSGVWLILTIPEGVEFTYALRFQFTASNNEAEYEVLVAGLRIAARMGVENVLVEVLENKSIKEKEVATVMEEDGPTWMTANRSLGEGIKSRLGEGNKNWVEELPHVLWAHRTMIKSSHDDMPFSLTYGTEAVIPTEIGMPTYRTAAVDVINNDEELRLNLDLLEERRERAAICEAKAKSKMMKYYNARVCGIAFKPGDFVYRSNDASHAVAGGKLGPKWEGPYEVTEVLGNGAYKLRSMDGTILPRTWNIANLK
nr:reverse transcriptase domain-containing protein [Tanacetum cinerariifolium]